MHIQKTALCKVAQSKTKITKKERKVETTRKTNYIEKES